MTAKRSTFLLRGLVAFAAGAAICPLVLAAGPAAASQSSPPGDHLMLSDGRLSGRFTLPADARVAHAPARIIVTADGHARTVATLRVPAGASARRPLHFHTTLPSRLAPGRFRVTVCVSRRVKHHQLTTCSALGFIEIPEPVTRGGSPGTTTGATTSTGATTTGGSKPTTTTTAGGSKPGTTTTGTTTTTTTSSGTKPGTTTSASTTPSGTTTSSNPTTTTTTTTTTTSSGVTATPDGPTSPVFPVTTTTTNYGDGCSYPKITTVPAPPPQTPTHPQTVTPNAVVDTQPAPFFPDGLGQYDCTANTSDLAEDFDNGGYYTSGFYVNVPSSYNVDTPETLVVQMHGCDATASSDIYNLSVNRHTYGALDNPYIMISLSGPEGLGTNPTCWSQPADDFKVLYDIYLAETYFNINRHRIILLGYSSGGDLGYSTIFHYADEFAGILGQNTNPWSQNDLWTGDETSTAQQAISMAAWPFNVLQVATSGDTVYPYMASGGDPGVEPVISTMQQAGFPAQLIETPGTHGQDDVCDPQAADGGDCTNASDYAVCTATSYELCYGSYYDEVTYLLATVADDGWESP